MANRSIPAGRYFAAFVLIAFAVIDKNRRG